MRRENAHDAKAVTDLASPEVEGREASARAVDNDDIAEEAVLIVAQESVSPAEYRGILTPELRARLDAMTRDYARILTRIDRLEARSTVDNSEREKRRRDSAS